MLSKICPCIAWMFNKSNSKTRKGYQYQPRSQLQQQQFMHRLEAQTKHSINSNQLMNEQLPTQQQIQNQLNQTEPLQKTIEYRREHEHDKQTTKQVSKPISKPVAIPPAKPVNNSTTESVTQEKQKVQKQNEVEPQVLENQDVEDVKEYGFANMGELVLNIPEYGPNYQLLKEKCHGVANLLDINQNCTEIPLNSKSKINKTKLRVWRKTAANCFIIEYQLPCSYSFFNEHNNKKIHPQDSNRIFKQSKLIQSIQQNLSQRYICLNKIGMLQPRQLTYLKYTNNSNTNPSAHWQLCISTNQTESQSSEPIVAGVKSGRIFSVSYIIEEKKQTKIEIKVRSYVNIDFGITVEKIWERLLGEVRNYVEEVWEEAANNYAEELV